MNIKEYIRFYKKILEPFVENYLTGLITRQKRSQPRIAELYEIFREAGKGGKCIRGSLVKLGYEIAAGRPAGDEILLPSAAFEILQTAILGHDDIIDKSPLRRGRDSIWRAAQRTEHAGLGSDSAPDNFHYGISQAICLGDVGIFLANRLIAESAFDPDKKIEAIKTFFDVQLNTVDGEMLDVLMSHEKNYADEEGVLQIATLKTAWYTVAGPLELGAVLGGASKTLLDALRRYGISLGVAFQLRDDILGIEAAEEETGKSSTSDVAEGKVTLLAYCAMKRASPAQLDRLRGIYGRDTASEADRAAVREIFDVAGAFAEVTRRAESYLSEAEKAIADITQDPEKSALLKQLGDMMVQRKS